MFDDESGRLFQGNPLRLLVDVGRLTVHTFLDGRPDDAFEAIPHVQLEADRGNHANHGD